MVLMTNCPIDEVVDLLCQLHTSWRIVFGVFHNLNLKVFSIYKGSCATTTYNRLFRSAADFLRFLDYRHFAPLDLVVVHLL